MRTDNKPCCAADAPRRIRQVKINGLTTGITMLDECIDEVKMQEPKSESEIQTALLQRVMVYNYIHRNVEHEYARALFEEYRKSCVKK